VPENQPTYYLYCEACDFSQDVEKVLPHTPLKSVDELRENVGQEYKGVRALFGYHKSGLVVPENQPTYYLYCEACDFSQDVAKVQKI